jgi:hypothetical protein
MKLHQGTDGDWIFFCPACHERHYFDKRWTFDGNMEAPTFTPSLRMGPSWRMPPGWEPNTAPRNPDGSYQTRPDGKLVQAVEYQCHLNITAGSVVFHPDCTHGLAGQTVPMEELP